MLFNFLLQGQLKWITERRIDEREKERESEHRKIPPNAQLMTPHSPPCPRPPSHQECFCKAERNTLTSSQPFWFHSVVNLLQLRQHCDKESWQCYQMFRHIKETIIVQIHQLITTTKYIFSATRYYFCMVQQQSHVIFRMVRTAASKCGTCMIYIW